MSAQPDASDDTASAPEQPGASDVTDPTTDSEGNTSSSTTGVSKKVDYAEAQLNRKLAERARQNGKKKKYQEEIASAKAALVATTRRASYLSEEIRLKKEAYASMVHQLGHWDTECMSAIKTIAQLKVEVEKKRFLGLLGENNVSLDEMMAKAAAEALDTTLCDMDAEQFQKYMAMTDEQRREAILGQRRQQLRTILIRNVSATSENSLSEKHIQRRMIASAGITFGDALSESLRFWGLDGPPKERVRRKAFREDFDREFKESTARIAQIDGIVAGLEEQLTLLPKLIDDLRNGDRKLDDALPPAVLKRWTTSIALVEGEGGGQGADRDNTGGDLGTASASTSGSSSTTTTTTTTSTSEMVASIEQNSDMIETFQMAITAKAKWDLKGFVKAIRRAIEYESMGLKKLRELARVSREHEEDAMAKLRNDPAMVYPHDEDLKDVTEYALCDSAGALRLLNALVSDDSEELTGEDTELKYNLFALPKLNIKSVFEFSSSEYAGKQRRKAELERKVARIAGGEEEKTGRGSVHNVFDNWDKDEKDREADGGDQTDGRRVHFDPVLGNTTLLIQDLLMFSSLLFVWCIMIYIRRSVSRDAHSSILGAHWLAERPFDVPSDRPWDYTTTFKTIDTTAQWWDWVEGPLLLTMSAGAGMHLAADFSGRGQFQGAPLRTICAAQNSNCSCTGGRVRFGDPYLDQWTDWVSVGDHTTSPINCSVAIFLKSTNNDNDPKNLRCQCETRANENATAAATTTAANVGGVYRLFGGWRIRQVRVQGNCGNFGGANSRKISSAVRGKKIRNQTDKLLGDYYGEIHSWTADCESKAPFGPLNHPNGCVECIEYNGTNRSITATKNIPGVEDSSLEYATYNPLALRTILVPPLQNDTAGIAIFRSFLYMPMPTALQMFRARFDLGRTFRNEDYFDTAPITGILGSYGGGGYVTDLSVTNLTGAEARYRLAMMRRFGWIDQQTRAVVARANFYNANLGAWLVVEALAEWESTGKVITSFKSSLLIPDIYDTEMGKIAGLLAAVLLVMLVREFRLQKMYWKAARDHIYNSDEADAIQYRKRRCAVTRLWLSSIWTWIELGTLVPCLFARITELVIFVNDKRIFPVRC